MKYLCLVPFLLASCLVASAQDADTKYQLSTHILDIGTGEPAPGVTVKLEKTSKDSEVWAFVAKKETGDDGRINDFLPVLDAQPDDGAIYRLTFYTQPYFEKQGTDTFYPYVQVVFENRRRSALPRAHHLIPLWLFHLPGKLRQRWLEGVRLEKSCHSLQPATF